MLNIFVKFAIEMSLGRALILKMMINCRQTRKTAKITSGYYLAVWQDLAIFSPSIYSSIALRTRPS